MLTNEDLQKILDHFYKGKITEVLYDPDFYQVKTNQGTFFIIVSFNLDTARETELFRMSRLKPKTGAVERVLLLDYKDELQEYSSYAHYKDHFYSLYKQI